MAKEQQLAPDRRGAVATDEVLSAVAIDISDVAQLEQGLLTVEQPRLEHERLVQVASADVPDLDLVGARPLSGRALFVAERQDVRLLAGAAEVHPFAADALPRPSLASGSCVFTCSSSDSGSGGSGILIPTGQPQDQHERKENDRRGSRTDHPRLAPVPPTVAIHLEGESRQADPGHDEQLDHQPRVEAVDQLLGDLQAQKEEQALLLTDLTPALVSSAFVGAAMHRR